MSRAAELIRKCCDIWPRVPVFGQWATVPPRIARQAVVDRATEGPHTWLKAATLEPRSPDDPHEGCRAFVRLAYVGSASSFRNLLSVGWAEIIGRSPRSVRQQRRLLMCSFARCSSCAAQNSRDGHAKQTACQGMRDGTRRSRVTTLWPWHGSPLSTRAIARRRSCSRTSRDDRES